MNIESNCIIIDRINISDIKSFVFGLSNEDWNSWKLRQKNFDVHEKTKTYPLEWSEEVDDSFYKIYHKNKSSYIWKLLIPKISKLESYYKGTCVNTMFANLPSGEKIFPHTDASNILLNVHRCHIPIVTNKDVKFYIDEHEYNFEEGFVYEINNSLTHEVHNNSNEDRIHLIVDVLPRDKNIKLQYICE